MAVILQMTYAKKLGLPGYSSHSCSVSLQLEIKEVSQAAEQSAKLYQLLQSSVDKEIEQVGFLPPHTYGLNGQSQAQPKHEQAWACSAKQKTLINNIVEDNKLDVADIDKLAQERFGTGLTQLNKLQASGLIDELLSKYGNRNGGNNNGNRSRFNRGDYRKEKA